jgi:phosphate acyltransferase
MRIGVDLMGSDNSPTALFEAVLQAANQLDPSSSLVVIATHSVINELRRQHQQILSSLPPGRIEFHAVFDTIGMSEEPVSAVFHKKGSSLVVGVRLLKKNYLDAFVSAGNTGALIASSVLHLPKLPGIKRPALLAQLPTITGTIAVLDIGGSVSCKAQNLVQFAYLGAAFQQCSEGIAVPTVGLLNIGVEPKKGTSSVRLAYQTLKDHAPQHMRFVGNVEGRDIFQGGVDVLVTDGFTGNVLLKASEGVSSFIFDYIQEALNNSSSEKLIQSFRELKRYFSYAEYPGAILCGVEGVVIKIHGNASVKAMLNGIKGAVHLVEQKLIPKLKVQLAAKIDGEQ